MHLCVGPLKGFTNYYVKVVDTRLLEENDLSNKQLQLCFYKISFYDKYVFAIMFDDIDRDLSKDKCQGQI